MRDASSSVAADTSDTDSAAIERASIGGHELIKILLYCYFQDLRTQMKVAADRCQRVPRVHRVSLVS